MEIQLTNEIEENFKNYLIDIEESENTIKQYLYCSKYFNILFFSSPSFLFFIFSHFWNFKELNFFYLKFDTLDFDIKRYN